MDSSKITHISLCSGYGGIDLGLSRVIPSLRTIAYSEIEEFAVSLLAARMESGHLDAAPIWSDLKTFPFREFYNKVGILSGGFPCQPFSSAGKRAGDEDSRHLFPHILRGIAECRPELVFLENVEGIISAKLAGSDWRDTAGTPVLLHVLRELERVGYQATAGVFSSAEIGASHQRKRVFILGRKMADPMHNGHNDTKGSGSAGSSQNQGWMLQPEGVGSPQRNVYLRPKPPGRDQWWWEPARVLACAATVADATNNGCSERRSRALSQIQGERPERATQYTQPEQIRELSRRFEGLDASMGNSSELFSHGVNNHTGVSLESGSFPQSGDSSGTIPMDDSKVVRMEGEWSEQQATGTMQSSQGIESVGNSSGEHGSGQGQGQWKSSTRRTSTRETSQSGKTKSSLGGTTDGSADWLDYAELSKSVDSRVDELRAIGNGVDPDVAAKAFIYLYNQLENSRIKTNTTSS